MLRGSDAVHPDTRQRVLAVIETLGFVPDASARGLTRGRKDIIGLVGLDRGADEIDIERSSLLFVDHIVHAAETVLRGTQYSLLLTFGSRGERFEKRVRALAGQVDGLIIAEEVLDQGELRALTAQLPVVVIAGSREQTADRRLPRRQHRRHDGPARHLRSGTVPQALLRRRPEGRAGRRRTAACVRAGRRGQPRQRHRPGYRGDFSEDSGIAAARILLGRTAMPQAVVCANDQMAIGVLRELQRAGVRIRRTWP